MRKQNNRRGFTITELIIVIVVIAILAAVLIPTFAGLIKKANMSADQQAVRQMNTILVAEEAVDGKPATVMKAKEILVKNGISDFTPLEAINTFYWSGSDNRVLLWTAEEAEEGEAETGKVTYPKELAKKYKDVTTASVDWTDLSLDYELQVIEPEDGQTLEQAFLTAVQTASIEQSNYLALPKNTVLTLSATEIGNFNAAMKTAAGVGKNVHIDLNGGTINAEREDTIFNVPDGGILEFANGKMNVVSTNYNHAGFQVQTGASLTLRDVEITGVALAMIFPSSKASEIVIDGCDIKMDAYYGLMTNGQTSDAVRVVINNSKFKNIVNGGGVGVLVNCGSNVHIENSEIAGSCHGLVMRAGHAEVINTTLETITTVAGSFKYNNFHHWSSTPNVNGIPVKGVTIYRWREGNMLPGAVLVLGDYSENITSYPDDVDCVLENVTFKSANISEIPNLLIAARREKDVVLTYDDATNFGAVTLYEMVPEWFGSITINGVAKTLD